MIVEQSTLVHQNPVLTHLHNPFSLFLELLSAFHAFGEKAFT